MPQGFESYNDAGKLQVQDSRQPVVLLSSGTVTTTVKSGYAATADYPNMNSRFVIETADAQTFAARMVAIAPNDYSCLISIRRFYDSFSQIYIYEYEFVSILAVGSVVPFWIFRPHSAAPTSSGAGLEVYDAAGLVTYSSFQQPLRVVGISSGTPATHTYVSGRKYAAIIASYSGETTSTTLHAEGWETMYSQRRLANCVRSVTNGVQINQLELSRINRLDYQVGLHSSQIMMVDITNYGNYTATGPTSSAIVTGPSNQAWSDSVGYTTFVPSTVSISGGTATSYTWSLGPAQGGTWGILSGQGTSSATINVSNVPSQSSASIVLTCVVGISGQATRTVTCSLSHSNYYEPGGGGGGLEP
jgi:hypothetical protein